MTFNSLTENEEHDIPSQNFKTVFGLHACYFFRPQYVWFLAHLLGPVIPNSSGQLSELNCLYYFNREDLYRKLCNIWRTKSQNSIDSHLVLHLSSPNLLKAGVK